MARCATCGNEYDRCFQLTLPSGETYDFDAFECAIQKAAPRCGHCGCAIIGHGIEGANTLYCCAHCARMSGHAISDNLMHDEMG